MVRNLALISNNSGGKTVNTQSNNKEMVIFTFVSNNKRTLTFKPSVRVNHLIERQEEIRQEIFVKGDR